MKRALGIIILIIILISIALYYVFWYRGGFSITPGETNRIDTLALEDFFQSTYSFSSDADFDGLSDAKEVIYGSDPLKSDTDGDGFLDGQEVMQGFDPIVAGVGTGRIQDRKALSLTIQYFTWLQEKSGDPDPPISEQGVREFLEEKGLLEFSLPIIPDSGISFTNDDINKIATYLEFLDSLTLPEAGAPYLALAKDIVRNASLDTLNNVIAEVTRSARDLATTTVPSLATELHRHYLGVWRALETMFEDLRLAQKDPVLIYLNQKRGEWLAQKIKEGDELRARLITNLKLAPFNAVTD